LTALLPLAATFDNSLNLKGILAHIQLTGVRDAFDLHHTAPKWVDIRYSHPKVFLGANTP